MTTNKKCISEKNIFVYIILFFLLLLINVYQYFQINSLKETFNKNKGQYQCISVFEEKTIKEIKNDN